LPDLKGNSLHALKEKRITAHVRKRKAVPENGFDRAIDAILLSRYVPASVVINHAMEILLFRGETDLYLRHSSGKATLNILKNDTT